jgi:hypothetical protein
VLKRIRLLGRWTGVTACERERPDDQTPLAKHFRSPNIWFQNKM